MNTTISISPTTKVHQFTLAEILCNPGVYYPVNGLQDSRIVITRKVSLYVSDKTVEPLNHAVWSNDTRFALASEPVALTFSN